MSGHDSELSEVDLSRELRLFDGACCGEMDEEVGSELSRLLRTSPEARTRYLRYTSMHADLARKVRAAKVRLKAALHFHPSGAPLREEAQAGEGARATRPVAGWVVPLVAMAAAASLAAVAFWPGATETSPSPVVASSSSDVGNAGWKWPGAVATIRRIEKARWSPTGKAWRVEDYLTRGETIEIAAGLVEVEFRQGAVVVLEGPARFEVESKNLASLHEGRMAAVAPPGPLASALTRRGLM